MVSKILRVVIIVVLVYFAVRDVLERIEIHKRLKENHPVDEAPIQTSTDQPPFTYKNFTLQPMASYTIRGKVLLTKRYFIGTAAELSPVDVGLGWGPLSDSTVLAGLKFSPGHRYLLYQWDSKPPIAEKIIATHVSNTHAIPASDAVKETLMNLKPLQIVTMEGFLLNISSPNGWRWSSSLSRNDTGGGACEVMWVTDAYVE